MLIEEVQRKHLNRKSGKPCKADFFRILYKTFQRRSNFIVEAIVNITIDDSGVQRASPGYPFL
jgi:hypothetical protein